MRYFNFTRSDGSSDQTCPPALGYSFAAGTTDGPGDVGFFQGMTTTSVFGADTNKAHQAWSYGLWVVTKAGGFAWALLGILFQSPPSPALYACQGAKPVLLDTDNLRFPWTFAPSLVDLQVLRLGQLLVVASPSEPTTMAGRRWRSAIARAASAFLPVEPVVLVSGPANTYAVCYLLSRVSPSFFLSPPPSLSLSPCQPLQFSPKAKSGAPDVKNSPPRATSVRPRNIMSNATRALQPFSAPSPSTLTST